MPAQVSQPLEIRPHFLGIDAVLIVIAVSFAVVGGVFDHALAGGAAGVACAFAWHRISAGKPRGFAIHAAYWTFGGFALRRTPPSSRRKFVG